MVDRKSLSDCIQQLATNCDSKQYRVAIETLLLIHRNILFNSEDVQYRKIRLENHAFKSKVWDIKPSPDFFDQCGWFLFDDVLYFNSDERLIDIIEVLLEHRDVKPKEHEWVPSTKTVGKTEEQLKKESYDAECKRKAVAEREKEIAEFKKDKKYRENLAKNIKAEIVRDHQRRKELTGKLQIQPQRRSFAEFMSNPRRAHGHEE